MNIEKKFIKSPLNYTGGKYKLLQEIISLFPKDIDTFVDLFGGGFNVGINVKCNRVIYNDLCSEVVDLLENFYQNSSESIHKEILNKTNKYELNRSLNKNEIKLKNNYLRLREDYNSNPNWILFYTLVTCSFSNQIRFNSKGEFNLPYGKRYYNNSLQEKLIRFANEIKKKDIVFSNKDFRKHDFENSCFVYCDPPYYNSYASYNENGKWSEKDEIELLSFLEGVDKKGIKFALSNNLKYTNPFLKEWKEKYNIHYLNADYRNCNYQKIDKSQDVEVLITNY